MNNEASNELGFSSVPATRDEVGLVQSTEARAVAEVQSAYVIAKKYPRNQHESYSNIIDACKRPFLAEQAMYAYPRGGSLVTGPSIRLAEAMAQCWGNLDCGVREISQGNGVSLAEAYAIDLQTNTRVTKTFHVPHVRDTKKGRVKLTDARDIYEMVANQGARRLRACILGILPGDVVEAAVEQCKKTLQNGEVPLADQVRKMVTSFNDLGVKVEHLETRLGHKLDATIPQEIVTLKAIYKSIKDGFAPRDEYFDIGIKSGEGESEVDLQNLIAEKNRSTKKEPIKDDPK